MKTHLCLFILSAVVGMSAIRGNASPNSSPEKLLRDSVTNELCYGSVDTYRGCIAALDRLFASTTGQRLLPGNDRRIARGRLVREEVLTAKEIGPFRLVTLQEESLLPADARSLEYQAYLARKTAIEGLFASERRTRSVDFDAWVKALLSKTDDAPKTCLGVLKDFYTYALQDPHIIVDSVAHFSATSVAKSVSPQLSYGYSIDRPGDLGIVARIVKGSAAEKSGLSEGDTITAISESSDPAAPAVELTVQRSVSQGPYQIRTIRFPPALLDTPYVTAEKLSLGHGAFAGYIRIVTFDSHAVCEEVRKAMLKLSRVGVHTWIVDLRDNLGGFGDEGSCVHGLFMAPDKVTAKHHRILADGVISPDATESDLPIHPDLDRKSGEKVSSQIFPVREPLVILQNEYSASASEYFAGGLRYHERALIVGGRSYGKGLGMHSNAKLYADYQTVVYSSATVMTFEDRSSIQWHGISPDFAVERGREFPFQRERHEYSESELVPRSFHAQSPAPKFVTSEGYAELGACVSRFDENAWYAKNRHGNFLPDSQLQVAKRTSLCWLKTHYPVKGTTMNSLPSLPPI